MSGRRPESSSPGDAAPAGGADSRFVPTKIISGGQTGVDRGALDAALQLGLAHGGSCPKGRLAEDGRIPAIYQLDELATADYPVRTERNVVDADATLIVCRGRLQGGTALTRRYAHRHCRPLLVVSPEALPAVEAVRRWLRKHTPKVLNVAGPRESTAKGIAAATRDFLCRVFGSAPRPNTTARPDNPAE